MVCLGMEPGKISRRGELVRSYYDRADRLVAVVNRLLDARHARESKPKPQPQSSPQLAVDTEVRLIYEPGRPVGIVTKVYRNSYDVRVGTHTYRRGRDALEPLA